jgi:glyoxylase-like metal-dependent hydrolase (beta-lactamase superfamily II)
MALRLGAMDVREVRPRLWRWTAIHPDWDGTEEWDPEVGCVYAEVPDAVVVVDPLVPADEEGDRFWSALDRDVERLGRPVFVLITINWHERSAAAVVERYGAELWRPEEPRELPPGVEAILVPSPHWSEAMFFLQDHRALVVGDILIGKDGGLEFPISWFPEAKRDWGERELKPRLLERLRSLPVDVVLVAHGEPVLEDGAAVLAQALSP